jgi:hypothetical protein
MKILPGPGSLFEGIHQQVDSEHVLSLFINIPLCLSF